MLCKGIPALPLLPFSIAFRSYCDFFRLHRYCYRYLPGFWFSNLPIISIVPTSPVLWQSSGDAGTFPFPPGSEITFTYPSAETALIRHDFIKPHEVCIPGLWPVAWSKLDICCMGIHPRYFPCKWAYLGASGQESTALLVLTIAPTIHRYLQICITFILVSLAWIFFRTASIHDALCCHTPSHRMDQYLQRGWI